MKEPPPFRPWRILLADDDEATRHFQCVLLSRAGYALDAVEDGESAWNALLSTDYDLLVTDNNMPKLSGLELAARMRGAGLTLPIIINSGRVDLGEPGDYPELRLFAIVQKEIGFAELVKVVKQVLPPKPEGALATIREANLSSLVPLPTIRLLARPIQPAGFTTNLVL